MSDSAPQPPSPTLLIGGIGGCLVALGAMILCVAAVPVVGIMAAIAIPNFVMMQQKAKRAELPMNVEGIRIAELSYYAAFDKYIPCGVEKGEARLQVGPAFRDPRGDPAFDCLNTSLGWTPSGPVRGAYWVTVEGDEFEVHGIADIDGDGAVSHYVATRDEPAMMVSFTNEY